jgi:hypothetical protein
LVFVAVRHAFAANDPTMRAIDAGFEAIQPKIVILESLPTALGENPPELVKEAAWYVGRPASADIVFAGGEPMYAVGIAVSRGIPFVGGEPTREEETQVLKGKGFTDADMAFSAMAGGFSQALRSGEIRNTSARSLAKVYPELARTLEGPPELGGWNLKASPLKAFRQHYKETYGVDIVGDAEFPMRIDVVNDHSRHGDQARISMTTRDRHLLGLIEQQVSERHSVLVVFGASHWSTLSAALESRLGKPSVRPFLE